MRVLQISSEATPFAKTGGLADVAGALPGWDPEESPRLRFFAATVDRRLGKIPAFGTPEFPWESDPTTWAELLLTR